MNIRNTAKWTTWCALAAVTAAVVPPPLLAQTEIISYQPLTYRDSNNVATRFERNYNTYTWGLTGNYFNQTDDIIIDGREQYSSSLIRTENRSLRDEQSFSLITSKKLFPALWLTADINSFVLSDNQSLGINNAVVHTGMAGVSIQPFTGFTLTPLIGMRYDKQQNETDQGVSYKFTVNVDTIDYSGYQASLFGRWNTSALTPRDFQNHTAQMNLHKDFGEGSLDSIRVQWTRNRWDFYIPADDLVKTEFNVSSNIRSRIEDNLNFSNALVYELGLGFRTILTTAIETRTIDNNFRYRSFADLQKIQFDSRIQELRLTGSMDFRYRDEDNYTGLFGILVSERDEKHILQKIEGMDKDFQNEQENRSQKEKRLDNIARRTQLRGSFGLPLSTKDFLTFDGSAGILRYDTPDSTNTDDRDELLVTLSSTAMHQFSKHVELSVTMETVLGHIVYLFKDRSANNNWNRIIRLSPKIVYIPVQRMRTVHQFEVMANYTVFDFEYQIPSVQSYSFRQFAFLDSISYDVTRRVGFDLFFHLRLYERGQLRWKEFSERPEQYIEEATFSPQLRYKIGEKILITCGFRSFAQNRFTYIKNVRTYESDYYSYGPTTTILLRLSSSSELNFQGWKELQQQSGKKGQDLSNVTMTVKVFI